MSVWLDVDVPMETFRRIFWADIPKESFFLLLLFYVRRSCVVAGTGSLVKVTNNVAHLLTKFFSDRHLDYIVYCTELGLGLSLCSSEMTSSCEVEESGDIHEVSVPK